MANVIGVDFESIADGEGVRVTIFFAGCKHYCEGCHNPSSFSFNSGKPFTVELQNNIIEYIKKTPYINGITLSGGDPMYSAKDITNFVKIVKQELPKINIWCYTGFTYEEIIMNPEQKELLNVCDILVDGLFELNKRDITLAWKGSSNQRIIDVKKSLESKQIIVI